MRVCVVGSSTGSIPFYLSLAFGLRTTGYEILQSLHRVACDVRSVCVGHDHRALIDFVCSDIMLVDDLEKHDAFILCSQCWDHELWSSLFHRIAQCANHGSIVIDYRSRLPDESLAASFVHQSTVLLPTSWSSKTPFTTWKLQG